MTAMETSPTRKFFPPSPEKFSGFDVETEHLATLTSGVVRLIHYQPGSTTCSSTRRSIHCRLTRQARRPSWRRNGPTPGQIAEVDGDGAVYE